jgi:cytochrome c-type biogenesis protein CcmE
VSEADTILAKHDETYMPKEVADALKESGHWREDYSPHADANGGNAFGSGYVSEAQKRQLRR